MNVDNEIELMYNTLDRFNELTDNYNMLSLTTEDDSEVVSKIVDNHNRLVTNIGAPMHTITNSTLAVTRESMLDSIKTMWAKFVKFVKGLIAKIKGWFTKSSKTSEELAKAQENADKAISDAIDKVKEANAPVTAHITPAVAVATVLRLTTTKGKVSNKEVLQAVDILTNPASNLSNLAKVDLDIQKIKSDIEQKNNIKVDKPVFISLNLKGTGNRLGVSYKHNEAVYYGTVTQDKADKLDFKLTFNKGVGKQLKPKFKNALNAIGKSITDLEKAVEAEAISLKKKEGIDVKKDIKAFENNIVAMLSAANGYNAYILKVQEGILKDTKVAAKQLEKGLKEFDNKIQSDKPLKL